MNRETWSTKRKILLVGASAIVILALVGSAQLVAHKPSPTPAKNPKAATVGSSPSPTGRTSPSPGQVAGRAIAPLSSLDVSGRGGLRTAKFSADNDWQMIWSYDCTKINRVGHFSINVFTDEGEPVTNSNQVRKVGTKDSGAVDYHASGNFYAIVNSECSWRISTKN